jgi:hypothetical protein
MLFKNLSMAIALTITPMVLSFSPTITQAQTYLQAKNPPDPPPTPRGNRTTNGGGLGNNSESCQLKQSIVALIPEPNPVFTTSEYPTFWFYIPEVPSNITIANFAILTQDEKTEIYRGSVQLPKKPGIIGIAIPPAQKSILAEGKFYHWYFELKCDADETADLSVNGWIQKIALNPENQRKIQAGTLHIWYDNLTNLATRRLAEPQSRQLQKDWENLLRSAQNPHLQKIETEPLVGVVRLNN